ncbi:hypothetical protein D3875_17100 [Deinococcus cavernae]|uniref:Uncharacterized protein n=1 Tax=Deinococcus cavernae TaxID=2320857 RepID=A0A418VAD8_9DEIO|nr:hypothetical protein [Deinococcus cavernae]RJF69883.1 hypothetical protein D3875_20295 [Deinococcus cavernae]RJF69884.1 hypothetical protein D3875_20310 [Deinococcus cavernae]RJF73002.1 hypothetical protein D3875_17100 [Deinococcus cavernae]
MNEHTFSHLANFLETWFNASFDFAELEDVLQQMKSLGAWENLDFLRHEALALGDTPLETFNDFSERHGGREFSQARFEKLKQMLREIEVEDGD